MRSSHPKRAPDRDHPRRDRPAALRRPGSALEAAVDVVGHVEATGEAADRVLREYLRRLDISGKDAAETAHAAYAWFRWRGLLERFLPDVRGLSRAIELEERFVRHPDRFDGKVLVGKAVPPWVPDALPVTEDWVRTLQRPAVLWLRARGGVKSVSGHLKGVAASRFTSLPEAVRFDGVADLYRTAAFRDGLFEIQDIASQAVGHVCAPVPGETWWDACAGEGGKMLHLADLMENRGLIWASDRSLHRLAMLKRRASRARIFNYRAVVWSDTSRAPTRTKFHGVLVDAPCSGVGTWARNPHARWTTTMEDVRELAEVQHRLVSTAAASVRPGGRLVYAVCTLTTAETTSVADRFEETVSGFQPLAFVDPFDPAAIPVPRRLWWPQYTEGNGMFVAAWRRVSH